MPVVVEEAAKLSIGALGKIVVIVIYVMNSEG